MTNFFQHKEKKIQRCTCCVHPVPVHPFPHVYSQWLSFVIKVSGTEEQNHMVMHVKEVRFHMLFVPSGLFKFTENKVRSG